MAFNNKVGSRLTVVARLHFRLCTICGATHLVRGGRHYGGETMVCDRVTEEVGELNKDCWGHGDPRSEHLCEVCAELLSS